MHSHLEHLHFIGVGGIGMSGLARIAQAEGYRVSGCDIAINEQVYKELIAHGCSVSTCHGDTHCFASDINAYIYNSAIPKTHLELVWAAKQNISVLHRAQLLALLMRNKYGI